MASVSTLDSLILDVASAEGWGCPCDVIVTADPDLSLLRAALELDTEPAGVWVCSRDYAQAQSSAEFAERAGARARVRIAGIDGPLRLEEFLAPATAVHFAIGQLPKSLEELDYLAAALASRSDDAGRTFIAGGNTKHMTRTQNEVLAKFFADVHASRGRGKFRCLVAAGPILDQAGYAIPSTRTDGLDIFGVGGVFSGAKEDFGGKLLATTAIADLHRTHRATDSPQHLRILDLGCGNGSVSARVAREFPQAHIIATDIAADAVESAKLTLAGFPHVNVLWDDAAASLARPERRAESASIGAAAEGFDVILLNPPFHLGNAVDASLASGLIDAAATLLNPGGTLYVVHNSHLRYRPLLERLGRVTQLARDRRFTVEKARRPE